MRDHDDEPPLNLDALRSAVEQAQADRVVGAAMARVRSSLRGPQRVQLPAIILADIGHWRNPILAAATIVLVIGSSVVLAKRPAPVTSIASGSVEWRLADWVDSRHVPTNKELLATFAGFSQ